MSVFCSECEYIHCEVCTHESNEYPNYMRKDNGKLIRIANKNMDCPNFKKEVIGGFI